MHQSDIIITAPVHFRGQIVGWIACHLHHLDVGAMVPGGFTVGAREIFQEGLRLPPVKIIERGILRSDLWAMLFNHIRLPRVALDLKAQIAANNVGRQRLLEMCERHDGNVVELAMHELLNFSEHELRKRLLELPDGTFRHIDRQEHDGISDGMYPIVLTATKIGDSINFDFTGSSQQTEGFINTCLGGAWAGVFGVLLPWIAYDIPWNAGLLRAVTVEAPEGTICNARLPAPVSKGGVGTMWSIRNAVQLCLSKLLGCSDAYAGETMAVWQGAVPVAMLSGTNQFGNYYSYITMDFNAGGCGAVTNRDGTNTAGTQASPSLAIPNVEVHEADHPLQIIFRRQLTDSAGAGKFRGGAGLEALYMVYDADWLELTLTASGIRVANAEGLFGGLPGSCNFWALVRKEKFALSGLMPGKIRAFDEIETLIEPLPAGVPRLRLYQGDAIYVRCTGGGGYGDPLDRDPDKVLKDLRENLVSREYAARLYGVVIDETASSVVLAATAHQREAIRAERIGSSKELSGYYNEFSKTRLGRRGEYLELIERAGRIFIACRCGYEIGEAEGDLKKGALCKEVPLREAGPLFPHDENTPCRLRLYQCPKCGTQIGAQIADKDAPMLNDIDFSRSSEARMGDHIA